VLRDELRKRARVQLFGEVWNLGQSRVRIYFELRDAVGAVPCSMWREDFEKLGLDPGALADGAQVVVAGGPDYYPGSRTSSPSFSFSVGDLRVAGEGDLLAQLARLRRQLDAEGLFEPQKNLRIPTLPRSIGVVTGERGKARDDVLAGLRRRGWAGRLVWAFAPCRTAGRAAHRPGARRPRGLRRGRGDRRRSRRRLARRPVRLLRRDAVPHRRPAPRSGRGQRRSPHRPHADRRRRRGLVLHPDARRRGRASARLRSAPGSR
jgi:hypothetical protein